MKRQYITTALTKLKANQSIHNQCMDLGIDATQFFDKTGYISLVEEAIATLIANGDDKVFETVLEHIQEWLNPSFEPHPLLYNADDFVNWIFTHYEVEE